MVVPRRPRPATAPEGRGPSALLRDRTYGPFFWGNLLSNCGTWFQNLAAAVVVYALTESAVWVGAVSVMQFAAALLLSPWAGALTDRVDRRLLLLSGQVLATSGATVLAVWTALVGVEGLPGPWAVLGAVLVVGVGHAFSVPAMQALVPALVPKADLSQAIALNAVTFNLARAVGPALGAATLVTLGPAAAFGINAVSYLALVSALLVIRPRVVERRSGGDGSVRAGLRYVRADRTMMVLLVGVLALSFGSDPVNTLTPSFADLFGRGGGTVGLLVSSFGAGAALTALMVSRLRRRFGQERLSTAGLVVLGGGMLGLAASPSPAVAMACLALAGSGFLAALTSLTTRIQQRVEEHMRGRVMALWSVAFLGSRPVAALTDGAIADLSSPRLAAAFAACVALATALVIRRAGGAERASG